MGWLPRLILDEKHLYMKELYTYFVRIIIGFAVCATAHA